MDKQVPEDYEDDLSEKEKAIVREMCNVSVTFPHHSSLSISECVTLISSFQCVMDSMGKLVGIA